MRSFLLLAALVLLGACRTPESETSFAGQDVLDPAEIKAAKVNPDFEKHVRPIFQTKCVMCHSADVQPGRMSVASQKEAHQSGALGSMIVPGQPDKSALLMRLDQKHAGITAMPPVGERLTDNEKKILRRWIELGAPWPKGQSGDVKF